MQKINGRSFILVLVVVIGLNSCAPAAPPAQTSENPPTPKIDFTNTSSPTPAETSTPIPTQTEAPSPFPTSTIPFKHVPLNELMPSLLYDFPISLEIPEEYVLSS